MERRGFLKGLLGAFIAAPVVAEAAPGLASLEGANVVRMRVPADFVVVRTALPQGTFRRFYQGVPYSASRAAVAARSMGRLDVLCEANALLGHNELLDDLAFVETDSQPSG